MIKTRVRIARCKSIQNRADLVEVFAPLDDEFQLIVVIVDVIFE